MFLSVIIPTRNRAKLLVGLFKSIINQTCQKKLFEVIVIDNGSTDKTAEICKEYKSRLPGFRRVYEETPGLHVGRHTGLKHSKGDILVYCDDDIEAFPTWLEGIVESFMDPEVGLVSGKILPKYETEPPNWVKVLWGDNEWGKEHGWYSLANYGEALKEISPMVVWGCNYSIRKKVLIEAGGFHPDSMPQELIKYRGDGEIHVSRKVQAMGYKTIYNPKASVYHWVPKSRMTVDYLKRRTFNQGISDSYTKIRRNYNRSENNSEQTNAISLLGRIKELTVKELIITIKRRLKYEIRQFMNIIPGFKKDIFGYKNNILKKAYQKGSEYHQNEVKNDPELLKWVLRENYFD